MLLALGHSSHSDHQKASSWFAGLHSSKDKLITCAITELGFLRISLQLGLAGDLDYAQLALQKLKKESRVRFTLAGDDVGADHMPAFVVKAAQLTDGHLLELATKLNARLVTLDRGIPGSLLVD
jgi:predicted nucleic acid-binding protein